jgi:hypothetical protein
MAYRKSNSRSSKGYQSGKSNFRPSDYVPTWNQSQTDATNLMTKALFSRLGISDLPSYFFRLAAPIVICALVGAAYGAVTNGFWGFVWGLLGGIAAPALLLWLAVIVSYCAVILGAYFAAWAVIIFGFFWLVGR